MHTLLRTLALLVCCHTAVAVAAALPGEPGFDFGRALQGTIVEHVLSLRNSGLSALRIGRLTLTPPLSVVDAPREILPGQEAPLRVRVDTAKVSGIFEGQVLVTWTDATRPPLAFSVSGYVFPPVEVVPIPAFFVSAVRGESKQATLDIVNHDQRPLEILKIQHPADRFRTDVETVEPGKRYRLTLAMRTDGPAGKRMDTIRVHTSSPARPLIRIPANIRLHERVHVFPDAIDLGAMPLSVLRKDPEFAQRTAQTVMVYQAGGTDFQLSPKTDLPLRFSVARGPKGDRFEVTIFLVPEQLRPGVLQGSIVVRTNDRDFSELVIPVTGEVVER